MKIYFDATYTVTQSFDTDDLSAEKKKLFEDYIKAEDDWAQDEMYPDINAAIEETIEQFVGVRGIDVDEWEVYKEED